MLLALGEPAKALPYFEKAVAMGEKIYPVSRFKDGQPDLASSLSNLGMVLDALGEPSKAWPSHKKALAMYQKLGAREIAGASETQALALLRKLPPARDTFLSAAVKRSNTDAACHDAVWHARGAVLRVLLRRQESAQVARLKSDVVRRKWDRSAAVRRQIHHLLVQPGKDLDDRDRRLAALEAEQSKLAANWRGCCARTRRAQGTGHWLGSGDLAARLPKGAVFLDFVHYAHFEKGKFKEYRYLAFVLSAGPKVRRVALRQAEDIDEAIASWLRSIERARAEPGVPARLRKLRLGGHREGIPEPHEHHLPLS